MTVHTLAAFQPVVVNVGNNGAGVCGVILELRNDGVGVWKIVANAENDITRAWSVVVDAGNGGVNVRNIVMNVRKGLMCVYRKFSLGAESQRSAEVVQKWRNAR